MSEEPNALKTANTTAEEVFKWFNRIFDELAIVKEVAIVFLDKANDAVIVEENCIGISKSFVKQLYLFAYKLMLEVVKGKQCTFENEAAITSTRCVVLLCPDCCTAWNIRKDLMLMKYIIDYKQELNLTKLVLQKQPKSSESFSHRRWLLNQIFKVTPNSNMQPNSVLKMLLKKKKLNTLAVALKFKRFEWEIINNEMSVSHEAARMHPSNYTAWSHRVWVIDCLIFPSAIVSHKDSNVFVKSLHKELIDGLKWTEYNVSDYSCMSYLEHIVLCLVLAHFINPLNTSDVINLDDILTTALEHNSDLLRLYNGKHEALWVHRRAIFKIYHTVLHRLCSVEEPSYKDHRNVKLDLKEKFSFCTEEFFCKNIPKNCFCLRHLSTFKQRVYPR
ncbi:protein prenyltransferase alpha subunit repeat-containing protein 1-like [Ciona intestinalis]